MKLFKIIVLFFAVSAFLSAREIIINPAWSRETELGSAQTHLLPARSPKFTIRFFKTHFQVSITTHLAPGTKPACAGKRNDDVRIFSQDCAEFLICTDKTPGAIENGTAVYYHIGVNPAGFCYTAKRRDISWNPDIKTSVKKGKNTWTAVMEIPYKEINTSRPVEGTVWRANFSSWIPMCNNVKGPANWAGVKDFHRPADMGTIRFGKGQIPRMISWSARDNQFYAEFCVPVKYASARAVCEIDGKKYPGKRSGSHYLWKIPVFGRYVHPKLFSRVKISLVERNGKEIFSRSSQIEPESRLQFDLKGFYCTPEMKSLAYSHSFSQPAKLIIKDTRGEIIRTENAPAKGKLSLAGLAPGRYRIELSSASQCTSRLLFIREVKTPQVKSSDRFEIRNGLFFLGGKPVFLMGASTTSKDHLQFKNIFNLKTGICGNMPNAVRIQSTVPYRFFNKPFYHYHLTDGYDDIIDRRMKNISPCNRSIFRLAYEAQFQLTVGKKEAPVKIDTPKFYADLYKRLKKQFPERYFSIQTDAPSRVPDFINSCDIIEFASYNSSYAVSMLQFMMEDMTYIRKTAGKKPVLYWLGGSIPNPVCRTAEELRAAVYFAIIKNINGAIIHLGHGSLPESRTRLWSLISGINAEISSFYPEFAAGVNDESFVTELKGDFIYAARKCKDRTLVIVINQNSRDQQLALKTRAGDVNMLLTPFEPVLLTFPRSR